MTPEQLEQGIRLKEKIETNVRILEQLESNADMNTDRLEPVLRHWRKYATEQDLLDLRNALKAPLVRRNDMLAKGFTELGEVRQFKVEVVEALTRHVVYSDVEDGCGEHHIDLEAFKTELGLL